ncbi:hypothetical protein [Rhodovulum marinum]|uniref:Uncharacterized protein n=1 Tax=Rhodovulum marinum TaxID=320662 RepID=A0A4R2Q6A0_9RHOB|nr:hypothetical protein [Rhodovulum marinum]TCP44210.1 hypothetical protein EV662_101301 [Rhodovulum marinum]
MNIRHERPDPALAFLVQAPLLLHTSADQSHAVRGWSPEGFEPPEDWPAETPPCATLSIPFQGVFVSFEVALAQDGPGGFVRFQGLSGRETQVLDLFHGAILRGEMAPVDGILKALDKPVDLVPMTRTEHDAARPPARAIPRALRAGAVAALYGAAAVFLWGALWSPAWERMNSIPLQAGRIEAMEPPRAAPAAAGAARTGPALVASGWIDGAHATDIYLGMAARLRVNVDGALVVLPARVTAIRAEAAAEGPARPGYTIRVAADAAAVADGPALALRLRPGGAAAIAVSTPILPDLRKAAGGLCGRVLGRTCGAAGGLDRVPAALPVVPEPPGPHPRDPGRARAVAPDTAPAADLLVAYDPLDLAIGPLPDGD